MLKKLRKGFTLVELVVVIAIIAILSAVSVVSFVAITDKARESNDISIINQLNKALAADEILNGTPEDMGVVCDIFEENGFILEKLTPAKGDHYYFWDQTSNRMVYTNSNYKVVHKDELTNTNTAKYWALASTQASADKFINTPINNNSVVYITANVNAPTSGYDISGLVGVYVSDGHGLTGDLNYINSTLAANSELIVSGNIAGKLHVDDADAVVTHYGKIDDVNLEAVTSSSYHEFGIVSGSVTLTTGRLVIEKEASVSEVAVVVRADSSANTPTIVANSEVTSVVITGVTKSAEGVVAPSTTPVSVKVETTDTAKSIIASDTNVKVEASGESDTVDVVTPMTVSTEDEYLAAVNNTSVDYVKLANDVEITKSDANIVYRRSIIIDGDGHKLSTSIRNRLVTISDVAGKASVVIKNITLDNSYNKGADIRTLSFFETVGDLIIYNSNILNTKYYAINLAAYTTLNINISNSTVSGWAALNIWGYNHKINLSNSTLIGTNVYSGNTNGFATIVFEADTTGKEVVYSSTIELTAINCKIEAYAYGNAPQAVIGFNGYEEGQQIKAIYNYAELINCEITRDWSKGNVEGNDYSYYNDGINNTLIINGKTITFVNNEAK